MALEDLSFKLYTDDLLTDEFTGLFQLIHKKDLSDNPQDFLLYFGSPLESPTFRELQATSNPGVDNVTLTPTDTVPAWIAATAYVEGYLVEPTTPNGKVCRCTTAGTSHATVEPTWPTVGIGSTVADGTCVWTLIGAKHLPTEIKLATTSGGLPGATGGAALSLGTTIESGVANAVEIHIRITNAVTDVYGDTGYAEIGIYINTVTEFEA